MMKSSELRLEYEDKKTGIHPKGPISSKSNMVFYRKCPVEICLVKPSPRFGSEQLITFVAMATPDDLNANAEFIRLADSFVEVPGADPLPFDALDRIR